MDEKRRVFLKRVAGQSLAAVGIAAAAGALVSEEPRLKRAGRYAKPLVKSFMPETTVYAQTTGAGTFTLKGTT